MMKEEEGQRKNANNSIVIVGDGGEEEEQWKGKGAEEGDKSPAHSTSPPQHHAPPLSPSDGFGQSTTIVIEEEEEVGKEEVEEEKKGAEIVTLSRAKEMDGVKMVVEKEEEDGPEGKSLPSKQVILTGDAGIGQMQRRQWLEQLRRSGAELETMTVLYAKSVLLGEPQGKNGGGDQQGRRRQKRPPERVPICCDPRPPAASPPLPRLRITRIDPFVEHSAATRGAAAPNDGGARLFRSTVCLLSDPPGHSGSLTHSLVMSRSSRVEIDTRHAPQQREDVVGTRQGAAMTNGDGTLTKFAHSLPNGHGLAHRLGGAKEWAEGEDDDEEEEEMDKPPAADSSSATTASIYRPAIRYRRKCPATGRDRRRGAAGAPNFGLSLCQPSTAPAGGTFAAFRHSIPVNNNEGGHVEGVGKGGEEDGRTTVVVVNMSGEAKGTANDDYDDGRLTCHPFGRSLPFSSRHPFSPHPPASSTDSGQSSAGGSPPFCPAATRRGDNIVDNNVVTAAANNSSADECSSVEFCEGAAARWMGRMVGRKPRPPSSPAPSSPPQPPSYASTASTIDQALRFGSSIFAAAHFPSSPSSIKSASSSAAHSSSSPVAVNKLASLCRAFIALVQRSSPSTTTAHGKVFQCHIELVRRAIEDVEGRGEDSGGGMEKMTNDYLAVCARQMVESCLLQFVRILCHYLGQCSPQDRLLPIGLEQFVHLLLFGDELCLEAVRQNAIDNLLALGQMGAIHAASLKLILRALAVLCGTAKGCLHLLSMGGLDFVLRSLFPPPPSNATTANGAIEEKADEEEGVPFEAAGCLAQLCNPAHPFVRPSAQHLVGRLLQLAQRAPSPQSLLLCMAALGNLAAQSPGSVCELLYVNNAVLKLIKASQRAVNAQNAFVQEQLVTILTRMANRGHERALLVQGAIPALCKMLRPAKRQPGSGREADLERRIGYKAAVCLGCLASTGPGLRALHEQKVYKVLLDVGRPENKQRSMTPVQLICASIRQKLENTYQPHLETAV